MWLEKLQNIDRRIIYTILLIVLFVPMAKPLGIPLSVNDTTQTVFDTIDAMNPADDLVLFVMDYSVGGQADVHPQAVATAKHLARKGIRTVMVAFVSDGPMFAEQIITELGDKFVYGETVINLGYMSGGETAVKSFVEYPKTSFETDQRGNKVADMPIMAGVETIEDFSYIIDFQTGNPGYQEFLRQLPAGFPYAAGIVTVSVPNVIPYYNSGQLHGLLQGLRGAAEYEVILGEPGEGAARMDAQSMGHVVIITFIIVGNLAYFFTKRNEKKSA